MSKSFEPLGFVKGFSTRLQTLYPQIYRVQPEIEARTTAEPEIRPIPAYDENIQTSAELEQLLKQDHSTRITTAEAGFFDEHWQPSKSLPSGERDHSGAIIMGGGHAKKTPQGDAAGGRRKEPPGKNDSESEEQTQALDAPQSGEAESKIPGIELALDHDFFRKLETMPYNEASQLADIIMKNPDLAPMPGMEKVARVIEARLYLPYNTDSQLEPLTSMIARYEENLPTTIAGDGLSPGWRDFFSEIALFELDKLLSTQHVEVLSQLKAQLDDNSITSQAQWLAQITDWLHLTYADLRIHHKLSEDPQFEQSVRTCYETLRNELQALEWDGFPYRQSLQFSYKFVMIHGYLAWKSAASPSSMKPEVFYNCYQCENGVDSIMSLPWESLLDHPQKFTSAMWKVFSGLHLSGYVGMDHVCMEAYLMVPCVDELTIDFFNKTHGIPIMPIAMCFYCVVDADNLRMTSSGFAHHDCLHASAKRLMCANPAHAERSHYLLHSLYGRQEMIRGQLDWHHMILLLFTITHETSPYCLCHCRYGSSLEHQVEHIETKLSTEYQVNTATLKPVVNWLKQHLRFVMMFDRLEEMDLAFLSQEELAVKGARKSYEQLQYLDTQGLSLFFTQNSNRLFRFNCTWRVISLLTHLYTETPIENACLDKELYLFLCHDFDITACSRQKTKLQEGEHIYLYIASVGFDKTEGHETRFPFNIYIIRAFTQPPNYDKVWLHSSQPAY